MFDLSGSARRPAARTPDGGDRRAHVRGGPAGELPARAPVGRRIPVRLTDALPALRTARCGTNNKESCGDHTPVHAVPAHPAGGSSRRGGTEPSAAGARRLCPSGRPWDLQLAAARVSGAAQRGEGRPRGDGRHRCPGGALSCPAAPRALRGHWSVDRIRRQPVPAQGPEGCGLPAGPHPRGDVHPVGEGHRLVLQEPSVGAVPNSDQVSRRSQAEGRNPAWPGIRHEGLVLVRPRRRRAGTPPTSGTAMRTSGSSIGSGSGT